MFQWIQKLIDAVPADWQPGFFQAEAGDQILGPLPEDLAPLARAIMFQKEQFNHKIDRLRNQAYTPHAEVEAIVRHKEIIHLLDSILSLEFRERFGLHTSKDFAFALTVGGVAARRVVSEPPFPSGIPLDFDDSKIGHA